MTARGPSEGGSGSGAPRRPRSGFGVVGSVVGRMVPAVMRNVDTDELLDYVDVNAVAAELDLNALVARLDVDAVAARLDMDALVTRLDVDAVAARLDMDALVTQLDVDAVAARLDMDALITQLDVDAVAARLDVDALVAQLDVGAVAERLDVAKLTVGATQDVAVSGLDLVRRQLVRADRTVDRLVSRLIRGGVDDRPVAPKALLPPAEEALDPDDAASLRRRAIGGHYAGPVTRTLTLAGDVFGSLAVFGLLGNILVYLLGFFTQAEVTLTSVGWLGVVLGVTWFLGWFWVPVALFDRTLAMAVAGIAVVARDGTGTPPTPAFVRALVLPFSVGFLALGLIGLVVGRERRALHDVAAGTAVVYDWGEREAEQPVTVRELLSARVNHREAQQGSTPG